MYIPKITQACKFKWALSWEPLVLERWNFLPTGSVSLLYSNTKFEEDPRTWVDMPSNKHGFTTGVDSRGAGEALPKLEAANGSPLSVLLNGLHLMHAN